VGDSKIEAIWMRDINRRVLALLLYLALFLTLQHYLHFWPFDDYISLDLGGNWYVATHITSLEPYGPMEQYAYPRLFHVPVALVHALFDLSKKEVSILMLGLMLLSLYLDILLVERLGGHVIGLFFVPFLISFGSYANVMGFAALLLAILNPSLLLFLVLGYGYPLYLPVLALYMAAKRRYRALATGSLLMFPYFILLFSSGFESMTNDVVSPGMTVALLSRREVPLIYLLVVYAAFTLPVILRVWQAFAEKEYYGDLTLPSIVLTCVLALLIIGWDVIYIHKYLCLLPVFSTVNLGKLKDKPLFKLS